LPPRTGRVLFVFQLIEPADAAKAAETNAPAHAIDDGEPAAEPSSAKRREK
jgi:hypothetical protein